MAEATKRERSEVQVLLLPPNLVGHIRLALLLAATALPEQHLASCALLLAASLALDALDGYLARRLNQATAFGAFYDVTLDIATRALLWIRGAGSWALLVVLLECFTFACTHKEGGAAWKTGCFRGAPPLVAAVMRNGMRSPLGAWVVAGLMGCPLLLWARRVCFSVSAGSDSSSTGDLGYGGSLLFGPDDTGGCQGRSWGAALLWVLSWGGWGWVVVPGRLLAAGVEAWVVVRHVRGMLRADADALARRSAER